MIEEVKIPKESLRRAYLEIINGYSLSNSSIHGDIFFKHLDNRLSYDMEEKQLKYKGKAVKRGLPTTEEKEKEIIELGVWDEKKQRKIDELKDYGDRLMSTRTKLILKAQIDKVAHDVEENNKKLDKLISEREELVGLTADKYAAKKVNEDYILRTSFKDKELTTPLFDDEKFEELSEADIAVLTIEYANTVSVINHTNIKRVAVSGFFLNYYYLCKDDPYIFFGKPIIDLSFFQADLFSYGRYFKNILSELKTPPTDEQMDDPDKLIELFHVSKNAEKVLKEGKATGSSDKVISTVVGATKEDMDRMGVSNTADSVEVEGHVSIHDEASKKGGNLGMDDLMKLHGM